MHQNGGIAVPSFPQTIRNTPHMHEAELIIRGVKEIQESGLIDERIVDRIRIL